MKKRLDILLVEQGHVGSRSKAQVLITEEKVFVEGKLIVKVSELVDDQSVITIEGDLLPYVSRGGLKLEKAIKVFGLNLEGAICADIGSSTGGFTDCMLQHGAKKVYAIDVGTNQLDENLVSDARVVVMENTNIRHLDVQTIADPIDFISVDVSFISLQLVLPKAFELLQTGGKLVALIKPQFEAGRDKISRSGVVRDKKTHRLVIKKIAEETKLLGFSLDGMDFSPMKGAKGNIEYLLYATKSSEPSLVDDGTLDDIIENAHTIL